MIVIFVVGVLEEFREGNSTSSLLEYLNDIQFTNLLEKLEKKSWIIFTIIYLKYNKLYVNYLFKLHYPLMLTLFVYSTKIESNDDFPVKDLTESQIQF